MLPPLRRRRLPSAQSSSRNLCGWIFVPCPSSSPAIFRARAIVSQAAAAAAAAAAGAAVLGLGSGKKPEIWSLAA